MTEAEALDMAAKAAGWRDWKEAHERTWELDGMRAHAATIMENAALRAEIERLTAILAELNDTDIVARTMADNAALEVKLAVAREALGEISRRTGLLIHQNTGRWDMRLEHDKRTVGVLTVNQGIARAALKEIDNGDR